MTLEQYKHEKQRLASRLAELDPATTDYGVCLSNLDFLNRLVLIGIDAEERLRYYEEEQAADEEDATPEPGKIVALPTAALNELDTPAEDEDEEDAAPEEAPAVTFAELHKRFANAAKNHIEVGAIIRGLGYEKLSAIPENRYADALAALDKAEKGQAE